MYLPNSFRAEDQAQIHALIQRHSFGVLVTQQDGAPCATHLPFMLDPQRGPHGTLLTHMARANSQWRTFGDGEALAIFQGPHTYISPSWYSSTPSVPTWNYAIAHAYGVPRIIEDEDAIAAMLAQLVDFHEAGFERPWRMELPPDYLHTMIRALVAFEIPIARLEGKFKLSQNRSAQDQRRVAEALAQSASPQDGAVAEQMYAACPALTEARATS